MSEDGKNTQTYGPDETTAVVAYCDCLEDGVWPVLAVVPRHTIPENPQNSALPFVRCSNCGNVIPGERRFARGKVGEHVDWDRVPEEYWELKDD